MTECFGCRKEIQYDGSVHWESGLIPGDSLPLHGGRSLYDASAVCLGKALRRIYTEDFCIGCGKQTGEHGDGFLCCSCQQDLRFGAEHRGEAAHTVAQARRELLHDLADYIEAPYFGSFEPQKGSPFSSSTPAGKVTYLMHAIVSRVRARALAEGVAQGSNLLLGLQSGEMTVGELNEHVEDYDCRARIAERDAEERKHWLDGIVDKVLAQADKETSK